MLGSTQRAPLEAWLEVIEAACAVLAPDEVTARHYGELRRELDALYVQVPYHDIWIGALARPHGLAVVTRDAHFDRIPSLRRIGW